MVLTLYCRARSLSLESAFSSCPDSRLVWDVDRESSSGVQLSSHRVKVAME